MNTNVWIELATLLLSGLVALGGVTWRLLALIASSEDRMAAKIEHVASSLDEKYNTARDEISHVKDSYVRRDDLLQHIQRLEMSQRDNTTALNQMREKLDEILLITVRATEVSK